MRRQFNKHKSSFLNLPFIISVSNLAKFNAYLIIIASTFHFAYFTQQIVELVEVKKLTQKQLCNIGDDCYANCNLKRAGDFCHNDLNMFESLFCDKLTK